MDTAFNLPWRNPCGRLTWSGVLPHFRQFLGPDRKRAAPPVTEPEMPEPKRTRHLKGDKHTTISMLKGGKRICKAYNDGRGCKGGCGAEHVCDVKLPNGKPCAKAVTVGCSMKRLNRDYPPWSGHRGDPLFNLHRVLHLALVSLQNHRRVEWLGSLAK